MTNSRRNIVRGLAYTLAGILALGQGPGSYIPPLRQIFPFNLSVCSFKDSFIESYFSECRNRSRLVLKDPEFEDGELFGEDVGVIDGRPHVVYAKPRQIYCEKYRPKLLRGITNKQFIEIVGTYDGPIEWNHLFDYVEQKKVELESASRKNALPASNLE